MTKDTLSKTNLGISIAILTILLCFVWYNFGTVNTVRYTCNLESGWIILEGTENSFIKNHPNCEIDFERVNIKEWVEA